MLCQCKCVSLTLSVILAVCLPVFTQCVAGQSKAVYEKTLHLEDLLELQHLRDPVRLECVWIFVDIIIFSSMYRCSDCMHT